MATGASNADLAVLLVDARKGVLTQTRRHAIIVLAARHPPRRAGGQQDRPGRLRPATCSSGSSPSSPRFAEPLGFEHVAVHPDLGALTATMSRAPSARTPWYDGPHLLDHLETIDVEDERAATTVPPAGAVGQPAASRFPRLCRHDRRRPRQGAATRSWCCRRGRRPRRDRIVGAERRSRARPQPATPSPLTLADEIDIARGDMLVAARDAPAGGRPVRRASDLDGKRTAAARSAPI